MERNPTSYLFQIGLIMSFIHVGSLTAFAFDIAEDSGDRIAQATTMYLTCIAFQFVVSTMLPKLPYLTILDKYMLATNFAVILVILQQGTLAWLSSHQEVIFTIEFDNYLLLGNFVYAVVHLFSLLCSASALFCFILLHPVCIVLCSDHHYVLLSLPIPFCLLRSPYWILLNFNYAWCVVCAESGS